MSQQIEKHIHFRYEVLKKMGSGAFGHVWKVINRKKKTVHALKKNFDAFQNSTDAQRTYRQIMFLKSLQHPNIIKLERVFRAENDRDIYLVFDFMDVDLFTLIRQKMLEQKHKKYIMYQVAKALCYLHSAQLVHRDIKPSNILVNENCIAKLCDFGLVRCVDEEEFQPILTQYIATRWYRAPQIILGSQRYTKTIDIWSFGCLLGEIIRGAPLFPGNSTLNQLERVVSWTGVPSLSDIKATKTNFGKQFLSLFEKVKGINLHQFLPGCSEEVLDLLNGTLQFNPEKRLTIQQVLEHPYFSEFYSKEEIITSPKKIKAPIDDNQKLTVKDYRNLIYKSIKESEPQSPSQLETIMGKKDKSGKQDYRKTVYNKRLKNIKSLPKESNEEKQSKTITVKGKKETILDEGKKFNKTKYAKTEEDMMHSNFICRKKNQGLAKYLEQKKKKSSSGVSGKRQSEVIAKYMYKNRYF